MLALSFFVIAFFYATVGFGGGSSYLAVLAVSDIPYELIPALGLICNLLVVSGGCWNYYRKGYFNKQLILPFVSGSVPMAFIGGMFSITEKTFLSILCASLIIAGIRLLLTSPSATEEVHRPSTFVSFSVGAVLGLLSGMIGIGGGIFLSPLMLNLRWGKPKDVAAAACVFICLNSVAGLVGQMSKFFSLSIFDYWPLFLAVFVGGHLGSRLGTHAKISEKWIQRGTAALILFISVRLLLKITG